MDASGWVRHYERMAGEAEYDWLLGSVTGPALQVSHGKFLKLVLKPEITKEPVRDHRRCIQRG